MLEITQHLIEQWGVFFDQQCKKVGHFLDKNPFIYKIVMIANHLFRASAMFAMMLYSPLHPLATAGILLGQSLLYRASVERFCSFLFTIPSMVGGIALWTGQKALISYLAGTAFSSLGGVLLTSVAAISITGYLGYICYVSHRDIDAYMTRINGASDDSNGCCGIGNP